MKAKWRFRCYPTAEQVSLLARQFGCCRVVYNHFLQVRQDAYRDSGKSVSYAETDRRLTSLKKQAEYAWLNEVSSVPLQQSLRHLQSAFANFFEKRSGFPTFRKKSHHQSATYTRSGFQWDAVNKRLTVAKMGTLKVRWSRQFAADPSSVTITRTSSGRYFVTMTLELPDAVPLPPSDSVVGVDLGLSRLATLSTGERIPNPRHLGRRLKQLAKLQRTLARRKKGSGRYQRQRKKIARMHERIADARKDTLDKLTTRIVREHGTICVEDLNVRGMVKNHSLARSLSDASLGLFRRMLAYKSQRAGRKLVVADRFFPSSKLCHKCGYRLNTLPLSCRGWDCPSCKAHHDRDDNASQNLANLAGGQLVTARGGSVRPHGASASGGKTRRTVNHPKAKV